MAKGSIPQPEGPLEEALANIARVLRAGGTAGGSITPRTILAWNGSARRGAWITSIVYDALDKYSLATTPEFEEAWIDAPLDFYLASLDDKPEHSESVTPSTDEDSTLVGNTWVYNDPTHRISKLEAANRTPVSVSPDDGADKCVALMMAHDFSQLPVVTSPREIKGAISWKSLAKRLSLGIECSRAADFMEPCFELPISASVFEAISIVIQHDFVIVRSPDKSISGIITATDLTIQFQYLSEPFLLLGEIENSIRNLIGERVDLSQIIGIVSARESARTVSGIYDLDFGQYISILSSADVWESLKLRIDRIVFCAQVDEVRKIRNNIVHFDPDGISPDELRRLQEFSRFLKDLLNMLPSATLKNG